MSEPTELDRIAAALMDATPATLAAILAESGRAFTVHAARRQAQRLHADHPDALFALGHSLADRPEPPERGLAALLLAEQYAGHEEAVAAALLRLADDTDWTVREYAANGLGRLLADHFDAVYARFAAWVRHPSANVRRAVAVATMTVARTDDVERAGRLLDLLEPLLTDRSPYVRKNLGPFAIGSALLVHHPDITFAALARWRDHHPDAQARWNLAMACSASGGARWPERSLAFLHTLADDPRPFVWRAVAGALIALGRRQPTVVQPEIRRWLDDPARRHVAERALSALAAVTESRQGVCHER